MESSLSRRWKDDGVSFYACERHCFWKRMTAENRMAGLSFFFLISSPLSKVGHARDYLATISRVPLFASFSPLLSDSTLFFYSLAASSSTEGTPRVPRSIDRTKRPARRPENVLRFMDIPSFQLTLFLSDIFLHFFCFRYYFFSYLILKLTFQSVWQVLFFYADETNRAIHANGRYSPFLFLTVVI